MLKKVCGTKITNPAITYIKQICWPEKVKFTCKQTEYGIQFESVAVKKFCDEMKNTHTNFLYHQSGIVIHQEYPFFSATPDGIVSCDCCGKSSLEVKCPWSLNKVRSLQDFCNIKNAYLKYENNEYNLDKNHTYYYQIQMQMALLGNDYCYFYVWGKKESCCLKIPKDTVFWNEKTQIANKFVYNVIVPELMANYYTKNGG